MEPWRFNTGGDVSDVPANFFERTRPGRPELHERTVEHCRRHESGLKGAASVLCAGVLGLPRPTPANHSADACDCQARKLDFGQHKRSCDKKRTRAVMDACWRQCCRNFAPPQDSRG